MLVKLAGEAQRSGEKHGIYTIKAVGALEAQARAVADTQRLSLKGLWTLLQSERPLVCWMYHSCLVGALLKLVCPRLKLVWNVRCSLHDIQNEKRTTRWVIRLLGRLRFLPDAVIFNSHAARGQHPEFCGGNAKVGVIPNGFDPGAFRRDPAKRAEWRARWKVEEGHTVVGLVARVHPMKGHDVLAEALRGLPDDVKVVFAGEGTQSTTFRHWIHQQGIAGRAQGLGPLDDVPGVLSALDLLVIPSLWGEGFPNVLGEAMACETACLVSDVGDSARILEEPSWVVPRGDARALAQGISRLSAMSAGERAQLGSMLRKRVEANYSLPAVYGRFARFLESVCAG